MISDDIVKWIEQKFENRDDIINRLSFITVNAENTRIIRCILTLSDSDPDSISSWVKLANKDYRDVIYLAEYDNRNVRRFNFNNSLFNQKEYSYPE